MKIQGVEVDVDAIAKGILNMVPDLGESYECALKLGMLPAPLMDLLERTLANKAKEISAPDWLFEGTGIDLETIRKDWVRQVVKHVSTAMYHHADMVV